MMTFKEEIIKKTVAKLIVGDDYRDEVINAINVEFLDFTLDFFKKILDAKLANKSIDLDWYKKTFINNADLAPAESAIFAGMNKKTITNIYGSATKEIVLQVANANFEYLSEMLNTLEEENSNGIGISIKLTYNDIFVDLNLAESLLVINALATKKMAIRGGAWSSIGKKVEKPLALKLCEMASVPLENIDSSIFKRNGQLDYDREVDFKITNSQSKTYRIEVKLMGRGNPESADVIFARDTEIFIADTLSQQNKNQFTANNVKWLELKNNKHILKDFKEILTELKIPHEA